MAEMEDDKENCTPSWVLELENRLQAQKRKLGHEIGAGAKCLICTTLCPGLELHYWRKTCKNCKCTQADHDVPEDDKLRFEILFKDKAVSSKYLAAKSVLSMKVNKTLRFLDYQQFPEGTPVHKKMKFDWIPPETSPSLAADYFTELPKNRRPISGSVGAQYRKVQLQRQIPMHDILPEQWNKLTKEEQDEYTKYIETLRENAGIGKIVRLKEVQQVENSVPCDIQPAQTSKSFRSVTPNQEPNQEPNQGLRNINTFEASPLKYKALSANPLSHYVEASPRSAMRSLPKFIPGSLLRLPSSFKPQNIYPNQPVETNVNRCNDSLKDPNDSATGLFSDDDVTLDSLNLTGVDPLNSSDEAETVFDDMSFMRCGVLEDNDLSDILSTPSKTARLLPYLESTPKSSASPTANGDENADVSDKENANNVEDTVCSSPENNTEVHLVEKEMKCDKCTDLIDSGSIAIIVEIAGSHKAWHPRCFICNECQELLVDLMYFFHKGKIYCARHYSEKLKIPRCFACDELIFAKEYTLADGHYYHINHFCCVDCDTELAGKQYTLNNFSGIPTCLHCFDTLYAMQCLTCKQRIKATDQGVRYKKLTWHAAPDCFKCSGTHRNCSRPLVGQRFVVINSKPYCSRECYI